MEEWMGRLQISGLECNYQELDRQLKEQFIHSLNDTEMLGEIIWELTKVKENGTTMREVILEWAKRVKVQRAQAAVMNSLTKTKEFDKIKVARTHRRTVPENIQMKMSTKQTCTYCGSSHPQRQCPAYWKTCRECGKIGHFRAVCRSRR